MSTESTLPNDVKGMVLGGISGLLFGMAIGGGLSWLVGGMSTVGRMFFVFHVCFAMVLTGMWTGPLCVSAQKAGHKLRVPVADDLSTLENALSPQSGDHVATSNATAG
mgnify:CR=1 FL=1